MTNLNLRQKTELLLKSRPQSLTLESVAAGAGVTYGWIKDFARGGMRHPSIDRVQAVHDYLAGAMRESGLQEFFADVARAEGEQQI